MPLLDVTELFSDPDFATTFHVVRTTEDVQKNGRNKPTTAPVPVPVVGVVQPAGPTTLARLAEGSNLTGAVEIWTTFPLSIGKGNAYQGADVVIWQGARYTVIDSEPWLEYGGHYRVVARLADLNP
jgi:hypothetical protein